MLSTLQPAWSAALEVAGLTSDWQGLGLGGSTTGGEARVSACPVLTSPWLEVSLQVDQTQEVGAGAQPLSSASGSLLLKPCPLPDQRGSPLF